MSTTSWNTLSSNSNIQQTVTVKIDDKTFTEHKIKGEEKRNEAVTLPAETKKFVLTFSYEADGKTKASELKVGGPWDIGAVQVVVIVAENKDDAN